MVPTVTYTIQHTVHVILYIIKVRNEWRVGERCPWKVVTYIHFIDVFRNEEFMIMEDDNSNLSSTVKLSPILRKNLFARFSKNTELKRNHFQRLRDTEFSF